MSDPKSNKAEEDVADDPRVAGSRAADEDDGSYVGRASADDVFDAGETGAEARSADG